MLEASMLHRFPPQSQVELTEHYLEWKTEVGLPRGCKGKTTGIIGTYNMKVSYSLRSAMGVEVTIENIGAIFVPPDILKIEEKKNV